MSLEVKVTSDGLDLTITVQPGTTDRGPVTVTAEMLPNGPAIVITEVGPPAPPVASTAAPAKRTYTGTAPSAGTVRVRVECGPDVVTVDHAVS